jgi:cobalt/nickel transport system permease protein
MHIPDGFLTAPVWLSFDVVSATALGFAGRRARLEDDESKAPLLGVMGAFVFAAQMINFPVGVGTSSHLVGSALLAYTLGPASAVVVMTAILTLQALIFQDGGLLALGANVFNMGFMGVGVAGLAFRAFSREKWRRFGIFAGGALSVFTAACLALGELLLSGVQMPSGILLFSIGFFFMTAIIEGVITVGVIEALSRINPAWTRAPREQGRPVLALLAIGAVLLASVGALFASASPDGLEKLAEDIGIADTARNLIETPLADYELSLLSSPWSAQVVAGLVGVALTAALCLLLARILRRKRG